MIKCQPPRQSLRPTALKLAALSSALLTWSIPSVYADSEPQPVAAGEEADITEETLELDTILVDGSYLKGSSLSEYEPELVLTESDIAAYGVSSIAELLQIIEVETSSGKTRRNEPPVVLINGRRVSGFRELDNYPVEALARVEVLPEEASLAYGFTANQRVINFILKADLQIIPINTRTQAPKAGGTLSNTLTVSRVNIDGPSRLTVRGKISDSSPLL
ncbi:MAG: hypothetical protein AAGF20_09730 [Pseudomonadota bacterium]